MILRQQRQTKDKDKDALTIKSSYTMAEQVRTAHLLIKHTGSRNPVSRRTGAQVTLSPDQALAELQSYEARINSEGVTDAFPKYGTSNDCNDQIDYL